MSIWPASISSRRLTVVLRTVLTDTCGVSQSLAILGYLDEKYQHRPLLPMAAEERAYVRQLAQSIACDIPPHQFARAQVYYRRYGADRGCQNRLDQALDLDGIVRAGAVGIALWKLIRRTSMLSKLTSPGTVRKLVIDDQVALLADPNFPRRLGRVAAPPSWWRTLTTS